MRRVFIIAALAATPVMAQTTTPASPSLKQAVTAALAKELKDGMTAQYRWPALIKDSTVYCGFVNAKNSYGAYVGFKPFMVMGAEGKSGKYHVFGKVTWVDPLGDKLEQFGAKECIDAGYNIATIPD